MSCIGSGRRRRFSKFTGGVGSGSIGSGRVGSGRVKSGQVGLSRVRSGHVDPVQPPKSDPTREKP